VNDKGRERQAVQTVLTQRYSSLIIAVVLEHAEQRRRRLAAGCYETAARSWLLPCDGQQIAQLRPHIK
jgi:hypothetical protein